MLPILSQGESAMNPDLIQRALMHYAEHLEREMENTNVMIRSLDDIAAFLWPEKPLRWPDSNAITIIDELKRRGLGNGK